MVLAGDHPAVLLAAFLALQTDVLAPPFLVEASGRPIDVEGGNSAPFLHDLDRDGLSDLLVGQFAGGHVRVYKNVGARGAPRFADFQLLRAGRELLRVPYG